MTRPPHAPWRAGAPRFTPALAPIAPDRRLRPDTEAHVLDWKRALLADPSAVLRLDPAGPDAALEAALSVERELGAALTGDLGAASALVSDDLVVMERRGEEWVCTALSLSAPTLFSIDHAHGRGLIALHQPVPDGARLAARIARVFDAIRPGQVLERFNWTLQAGADRFTPDAAPLRARAAAATPEDAEHLLHVRVERQTISRLPETGAVLFTIRVCIDPIATLDEVDRAALANAWRSLVAEGRTYKGWAALDPMVSALFQRWQV